ncbi:hypothetical protein L0664_00040 [Octadecabacter sp. G9-8]|uniref:Transposase n=1 Tax=Octadecabacter dasysiphoniae TaxID=2909341 RepID=A0ABS9CST0_9RHOB|nr:hypothetical protein [Octadecabacter dasysiphoniae]MCF2869444.1 hypothetical protein [Octadecabacter dasysiphoniae]
MEAGKRRLAGDTARAANTDEVKDLRRVRQLKQVHTLTHPTKMNANAQDEDEIVAKSNTRL